MSACDSWRMVRRTLPSSILRVALAYLVALQALLGGWMTNAAASVDGADPINVLCRTTAAAADDQDGGPVRSAVPHCAVMCMSGACAAGDLPAAVALPVAFRPFARQVGPAEGLGVVAGPTLFDAGVSARGPPSTV